MGRYQHPTAAQTATPQGVASSPFGERVLEERFDPEQVTGRGMSRGIPGRNQNAHHSEQGAYAPFSQFAPDSEQMRADAEGGREEGRRVFAIVFGLLVAGGSVLSVMLAFGVLAWLVTSGNMPGIVASNKVEHLTDDQVAEVTQRAAPVAVQGRGTGGKGAGKSDGGGQATEFVDPLTLPGPVIVQLPDSIDSFQSVEVVCPSGSRSRGRLRNLKAMVEKVPVEKGCQLRLQGTRAVSIFVNAHNHYRCSSLEPVSCRAR